ncbi:hypothetical protein K1719_022888 [Acacia pycnantha]|nr:hypothetical protein K1719_022888 [Acacia pycnantha]
MVATFTFGSGREGDGKVIREVDDIVHGWRGFFAQQNAKIENTARNVDTQREEDVDDKMLNKYLVLPVTQEQYTTWCRPLMNSLIIKVLGMSVQKHVLFDRVR